MTGFFSQHSIAILETNATNKFHSNEILSFSLDQFIFISSLFRWKPFFFFLFVLDSSGSFHTIHVAECGIDSNWSFDRYRLLRTCEYKIAPVFRRHSSMETPLDRRNNEALFSESHGRCRRTLLRTLTTGQVISAQLLMDWHDRSMTIRLPRHRSKSCIHVLERLSPGCDCEQRRLRNKIRRMIYWMIIRGWN